MLKQKGIFCIIVYPGAAFQVLSCRRQAISPYKRVPLKLKQNGKWLHVKAIL